MQPASHQALTQTKQNRKKCRRLQIKMCRIDTAATTAPYCAAATIVRKLQRQRWCTTQPNHELDDMGSDTSNGSSNRSSSLFSFICPFDWWAQPTDCIQFTARALMIGLGKCLAEPHAAQMSKISKQEPSPSSSSSMCYIKLTAVRLKNVMRCKDLPLLLHNLIYFASVRRVKHGYNGCSK